MNDQFFFRNPEAIAFGLADCCTFLAKQKVCFTGDAVRIARWIFGMVSIPTTGEDILAGQLNWQDLVHDTLSRLVQGGIIFQGTEESMQFERVQLDRPIVVQPCDRLIVGVSGAVQAADIVAYLDALDDFCDELQIILTEAALNFINPCALEYLYGCKPWVDLFETRGEITVPHIQLACWADLMVIVPTSAHTIYRLANGACSNLLSLVATATRAPLVVVPGMSNLMWSHPAVQRNVDQLRADGVWVVEPGFGQEVSLDSDEEVPVGSPVSPTDLLLVLNEILNHS